MRVWVAVLLTAVPLIGGAIVVDAGQRGARSAVERAMADAGPPGLSVAVVRHGRVIWADGFGYANTATRVPATAQTVYEIGSLGKQFTATAVELLAADQRLDLDAPLSAFLPGLPEAWAGATLRRTLVHQSGIPQIAPPDRALLDLQRDYTAEEYTALATSVPLDFEPGTSSTYSDTGYVLLGFVLDRVLRGFYGDFLEERVFRPLGMSDTRIIDDRHPPLRLAQGYERRGAELQVQAPVSVSLNRTADGSLWSTVEDLARWEAALESGSVLPKTTLRRMWQVAPLRDGHRPLYHYGEGWERNRLRDVDVMEYDGSWQGFHGAMARYPRLGLMVVVLGNVADWRAQRLAHDIAGEFDARARPYRTHGYISGCEATIRRWLRQQRDGHSSLARELQSVGALRRVVAAERVPGTDALTWVYRVEADQMDDWMTIRCAPGGPQLIDLYREY